MSIILTEIDIHGSDIVDQRQHTLFTPLRSRVDATQRLEPPKTPNKCKKFCGHKLFVYVPERSSEEVNSNL